MDVKLLKTTASAKCDAGERNNEDSAYLKLDNSGVLVAVIADGVGGLNNGEIASRYITKAIEKWFDDTLAEIKKMQIEEVLCEMKHLTYRCHEELLAISEEKEISIGSTLTFILLGKSKYGIIQVGDSRAYLYSKNFVTQITKDQTVAEYEKETGETIDRVPKERKEHVLMQCMGMGEINPVTETGNLPENFDLLLCSDGLSNTLTNGDIQKELKKRKSCTTTLNNLINLARSREEEDNITGILIRRGKVEQKKRGN